jgi:hypothetical protein
MRRGFTIFTASLFVCLFLAIGCEDEDEGVTLTSSHEGWADPGCWGSNCHDKEQTHNSTLNPYQCVECHGKNGSPSGHTEQSPCADCHETPHGNDGFPDPESCLTCHG